MGKEARRYSGYSFLIIGRWLFLLIACVYLSLFVQAAHAEESLGRICDLFPDASLAQTVANGATGGDVSAEVTQEMLDSFYGLNVSNCGNWEGLSLFGKGLESLDVVNGGGNVEELSALTGLRSLSLNNVTTTGTDFDLSALDHLTVFWSVASTYAENTSLSLPVGLEELDLHTSANLNLTTDKLASVLALKKLRIVDAPLSGKVSKLQSLKNLTEIHLCDNAVSGSLADFSRMAQLKVLDLTRTNITGDLSSLSSLSSLEELNIGGIDVTGDLSSLSKLSSLNSLYLGPKDNKNQNSQVKGDLSALSRLTNLQSLGLEFNAVSGNFSSLSTLKNLEYLSMQYTQADGSLRDLCGLTRLGTLQIGHGVDFDFAVDSSILNLNNLHVINVYGAKVSGEIGLVESLPAIRWVNMIDATIILPPSVFEDDQPIAVDIPAFFKDLPLTPMQSNQAYSVSGDQVIWNVPQYSVSEDGANYFYRFSCSTSGNKYTMRGNVRQPFTKPRVYLDEQNETGSAGNKKITNLTVGAAYAISSPSFDGGVKQKYRINADGTVGDSVIETDSYEDMPRLTGNCIVGLENYVTYCVYELNEDDFIPTPTPTPEPPQDGGIVEGENAFDNLPPVTVPTIVIPNGTVSALDLMLKYNGHNVIEKKKIKYDVWLVNSQGEKVDLPSECILCFPYPEGLDETSKRQYRVMIHHYNDEKGVETFSTEDGTIELTKQGLCIRISSLSPFEIIWEEQPKVDLPKTGDNSQSGLWLAMLALASVALIALRRKTV